MNRRLLALALLGAVLGGCATKRDLRDLQAEVHELQRSNETLLREIQRQNLAIMDSLGNQDIRLRGEFSNQMVRLERQLVQIQELTGQGQLQLAELREAVRQREEAIRTMNSELPGGDAAGDPDELFDASRAALERGSFSTARAGFEEFVRIFPQHPRAPEAQLGVGEAYEGADDPVRALEAYSVVLELHPNSTAAPTALYRAAMIEVGRDNRARARTMLNQLVTAYPRSPEAPQARTQLQRIR